jgi:hypothetical protein
MLLLDESKDNRSYGLTAILGLDWFEQFWFP